MSEPDEIQEALDRLFTLEPTAADTPSPPAAALAQIKQRAALQRNDRPYRSVNPMSNRRIFAAGLVMLLAVALLMAFPSVRAAANDFLGLFRVQKFAPISVSPQQVALLNQLEEQGLTPGEIVPVTEPGDPVAVDSLEAAAAQAGYMPRRLHEADGPTEVYVTGDAAAYMIVDLAGARAIVEAAGADPTLLPDSLDGQRVDVHVYPVVQQLNADGLLLVQTPSPDVTYPSDVDPTVLGEALLRVLGTDPDAARRLAQSIDWTSTMLLPIPQTMGAYREVSVDGVTGVALEPFDSDSDHAVIWQKGGMVYVLSGPAFIEDLIKQANRLQ
jgi:hypothetical protein